MGPELTAMKRPFNPWDMFIGLCYGVQFTRLALYFSGTFTDSQFGMWASIIFLVGLVVQMTRQWQSKRLTSGPTDPHRSDVSQS